MDAGSGGYCADCLRNANDYNPLVIDTGDPAKLAEELYEKAAAEPDVTRDLLAIEEKVDGSLNAPFKLPNGETAYPLDAKLKTKASTQGKIEKDVRDDGVTATVAAGNIKDNLRYTYTLAPDAYGDGVKTVLDGLGYERMAVKNFWDEDAGYASVHGIYRTRDGQYFEVQFHTASTIETKELLSHPIYELQKKVPADSPAWAAYQEEVDDLWQLVRDDPPNLAGVP